MLDGTIHAIPACGEPLFLGEDETGTYHYCPQCDLEPPDDEIGREVPK